MKHATKILFLFTSVYYTLYGCRGKMPEKEPLQQIKLVKLDSSKSKTIEDTTLYLSIGNPDTSLVIFMYKNADNYDYDLQREEYIRWDLEEQTMVNLFKNLYKDSKYLYSKLNKINSNKNRFIQDARKALMADYKEYNYISDMMEFEYFLQKKDSMLLSIVDDMCNNKKVSIEELNLVKKLTSSIKRSL